MVEAAGYSPIVLEYLKTGWTLPQLYDLMAAIPATPRESLRDKGTPAKDLGLLEPGVSDETILREMVAHPVLVDRPIVVTPKGARLRRPWGVVLTLLDHQAKSFFKEDGEVVRPGLSFRWCGPLGQGRLSGGRSMSGPGGFC